MKVANEFSIWLQRSMAVLSAIKLAIITVMGINGGLLFGKIVSVNLKPVHVFILTMTTTIIDT